MGRVTYEFGYRFGMQPGQNPYPHMTTIVFSRSLELPDATDVELQEPCEPASIDAIRRRSAGPIYLCGGGAFAGSLLATGQIDILRLKRVPIILGDCSSASTTPEAPSPNGGRTSTRRGRTPRSATRPRRRSPRSQPGNWHAFARRTRSFGRSDQPCFLGPRLT